MVTISQKGARIFASDIMEDIYIYAENHQDDFVAFAASTCDITQKLADTQNDEPSYIQRAAS